MRSSIRHFRSFPAVLLSVFTVGMAPPIIAQVASPSSLSIHGYLTQAYGFTSRDTVMGLTPQGTADYRRAAIVARYATTPTNAFVVQLGHRRLGDSPTMRFENNVKVDMAFVEHRFGSETDIRIGRSALPTGIFNEVRYVGTLLPFYRAPYSVYGEGSLTSETLNGVVVSHRLRAGEAWEVSADLYGGGFEVIQFSTVATATAAPTYAGQRVQAKNVLGGRFWLTTPVEGLRVGSGGRRMDAYTETTSSTQSGGRVINDLNAAIDGHFEKWQVSAEVERASARYFNLNSRYVQLGVTPIGRLTLNVQREYADINASSAPGPFLQVMVNRDDAVGVNFLLDARTVLKLEQHRSRGFNYEQVVNPFGPRIIGSYFIASMSTSF